MTDLLIEEIAAAVRILTMNRPGQAQRAQQCADRGAARWACARPTRDESVRSIVLTGAGPAFCAGADLSEFKDLTPDKAHLVERRAELTMNLHGIFSRLSKPVVTADQWRRDGRRRGPRARRRRRVVMVDRAKLGYPEVKHGIVAAIVMANLVRNVGRKAAFELVATGEPVDAARALALGMVNRVTAPEQLMDEAVAAGGEIRRGGASRHGGDQAALLPCARSAVRAGA